MVARPAPGADAMKIWSMLRACSRVEAGLPADFRPDVGLGGGDIAALAQRLFWAWALMAGVALFGAWWMQRHGWWRALVDGDPSGISVVIAVLAVVVTGWCGLRAWRLQGESRPGAGHWRAAYLADLRAGHDHASALLSERTHGPHETAWWFAAAAIKLGLLGTVVGFILMSSQLGKSQSFELAEVQQLLQLMTGGMAIALYTTLVGLVANLWLGLQLLLLDRLADRLAADILADGTTVRAAAAVRPAGAGAL
ncbi:hypothetical protein Lcho_1797 [Leptothrix cholodnii SP-6]|uniref:MotA/TolQ/ExbB proton channel domain-containing protein n=2 Tax=Leptothrix cholodnii TaxID=34029 RepID=B1XZ45_LEPCP|nr:hypothetical protein Lcho_1797 [Leptothrix cholodnii SP-6]